MSHVCDLCVSDKSDTVALSGLTDRCGYTPYGKGRCTAEAVYEVDLVYCDSEHCINDPAHNEDCGESPSRTVVCADHGAIMRTRPDMWQCFRSIRTLRRVA